MCLVHGHTKTGLTEPVSHQVRHLSGSGEGRGKQGGARPVRRVTARERRGQGAGMRGAYGPGDQAMHPGARAVPAACPSGGSPTATHGHSSLKEWGSVNGWFAVLAGCWACGTDCY